MPLIDPEYRNSIRKKYNEIDQIWETEDKWHDRVHKEITAAVIRLKVLEPRGHELIIDVGSGGEKYNILRSSSYIQIDLAFDRLRGFGLAICADAHALPIRAGIADCVLCVGPVVNYCSLIETVSEISRVAKPGGWLILHVELSNSLEHAFSPAFGSRSALVTTFYRGEEKTWVYSKTSVFNALENAGFDVMHKRYFHVFSALAYRIFGDSNAAARWAVVDSWLNLIPGIGAISDSVIVICRKRSS
jgi:SAM-dependent methyltransferase